ncbi:hypothetical protein H112_04384 [Trichophyton rubrum D6]|uniref:Uncharacterized protein n=4 Tax=Trichophyton TaxID=5550 RepID=A0A178F3H4_TRIRU|nr:uncharacterized protein TERG_04156 [Trichophyton rubrum CBS 118892]EZF22900.1 hypothetical protein H100_04393 [Trichophyton rubrum MR850]EZF41839.1 hypothetical protein H102_04377 [Trichophyton rubrum CBS 100081]EZF52511.1 hypothetical protein H103_04386 [Trichophyton rubrum CBS 288.86]EZF63001.1 hypothetical protein H104_04375 [Trichophyton rubrum CBS 289.86]EZF73752.1 hypothetical protein H105_04401 [Trichophyton soudanense CBS 452.61]EZF84423.1 hypothetical protein H110_04379 [Trichophy
MLFSKLLVASCISPVFGSLLPKDYVSDLIARQAPGEDIVIIEDDDWLKSLGKATATLHRRQDDANFPYIKELRKVLQERHNIDGQSLPYGEVNPVQSSLDCTLDCSGTCNPAATYTHRTLRTITNVTVAGYPNVDEVFHNPNDDPLDIEVKKGTAVARGNTKGWSIGVGLNGGLGPLSAEFSGQISQLTEEASTETREVSWKGKCPSKTECRVTTATFSITVKGMCNDSPFVYCLTGRPQKRNMCGESKDHLLTCLCPVQKEMIAAKCPKESEQISCDIIFPLRKPDGSLRTVQYLTITPISK